jgi:2-hydroxychromene-2-carboxylate isomerase
MAFEVFFDFVSPYAFVAFAPLVAMAERHGRGIEPTPVLFAALLNAHGNVGPAEIPAKRAYIFKDAYRKACALGRPNLVLPPTHPFNPLVALRVASLPQPLETRIAIINALFDAAWQRGEAIDTPAAVRSVLDRAGHDGAELVARAEMADAKAALRTATDTAIARGVFGVPTVIVDDELFFGSDALPHIEAFLKGADPVGARVKDDPSLFIRPASAVRKKD